MEERLCQSWYVHFLILGKCWVTILCNAGFTRRIIGVPKAESDAVLSFLFHQISENPDHQVRFKWEPNSMAIWDNRVRKPFLSHSILFADSASRLSLIQQPSTFGLRLDTPFGPLLMERDLSP